MLIHTALRGEYRSDRVIAIHFAIHHCRLSLLSFFSLFVNALALR